MIPEPNANSSLIVWEIAVPAPLHTTFEYLPHDDIAPPEVGARVRVPFSGRESVGFFVQSREATLADPQKLKRVIDVVDHQSLIEPALLTLLRWVADYYLIPPGDALMMGLARNERKGKRSWTAPLNALKAVTSLKDARIALARAPQQLRALELIGNEIRSVKDIESEGI
jgi:primosomal protein N' (replication factor Y)